MRGFHKQPGVFERPRGARGLLPLIMGALAVGKGIYGAIDANQKSQKNKGYINESYRAAKKKLGIAQGVGRQNTAESLNARGLGGPAGAGIRSAMGVPTTMGQQQQVNDETQYKMEQTDLNQQHDRALAENKAARTGAYIGAGINTAQGLMGAYNMAGEMGAMQGTPASIADASSPGGIGDFGASGIRASMTGIDDPVNAFGGIHPLNPLGARGSTWNRNAMGESNADFNVG